jgi:hypothetical protein
MAPREEPPHDVLAAEEFGVPAPDPTLAELEAHDVLAAEEFGVPAPDPTLNHPPVVLPSDLTGATEPRDVLAAEEFAMPAPRERPAGAVELRRAQWSGAAKALGALAALTSVRRLARRLGRRS